MFELALAVVCGLSTVALLSWPIGFVRRAQRVTGVVVGIDEIETHDGPAYAPVIEYTLEDGRTARCTPLGHSIAIDRPLGTSIEVLVDPATLHAKPATFGDVWLLPVILASTTGAIGAVAILHAFFG